MQSFKHCPLCAGYLHQSIVPSEGRDRLVCEGCGYIFYLNPRVVCGSLPVQDGKLWLLRRGIEPRLGYWTYPAGYQELDETCEEAAIRETYEEIGVRIQLTALLGVYSRANAPVVNIVYLARLVPNGTLPAPTDEALEVALVSPKDIPWSALAFESTTRVLADWVRITGYDGGG